MSDLFEMADQAAPETAESELTYVGEGKKYSDVSKLDHAYAEAESFIEQLKAENAELRSKAESTPTVDELISKLQPKTEEGGNDQAPDQEELATVVQSLVNQTLESRTRQEQMQKNATEVVSALRSQYGEKAQEVLVQRSAELGVDLSQLAMTSPQAALKLIGDDAAPKPEQPAAQTSSVKTEAVLAPQAGQVKTGSFVYWKDLYKQGKISRDTMLKEQAKSAQSMSREDFFAGR